MREPETDVFHAELIDDGLGRGVRLYDATDAVYEMRDDDVQTRIYPENGMWRMKGRIPVEGTEAEAYEAFRDTAHRIGDAYDWDVTVPAYSFMDGDHCLPLEPDGLSGELRYSVEDRIDLDIDVELQRRHSLFASAKSLATIDGFGGALGALAGAGLGAMGGAPLEGAMAGSALGGTVGTGIWSLDTWCTYVRDDHTAPTYEERERVRERLREKKEEQVRKGDELRNQTLLDRVNERNRLAADIDQVEDYGKAERLKELEAGDAGALFDAAMDLHFDQFHRRDGVIMDAELDSYRDAYRLATVVADAPQETVEQPSLYADMDAFRGVFEALPDRGQDVLVGNVMEHGASDAITAYLDAEHAERVRQVGGEAVLNAVPTEDEGVSR